VCIFDLCVFSASDAFFSSFHLYTSFYYYNGPKIFGPSFFHVHQLDEVLGLFGLFSTAEWVSSSELLMLGLVTSDVIVVHRGHMINPQACFGIADSAHADQENKCL